MKKTLLDEAIRLSMRGLKNHPQLMYFPHFSYIVKNNQIISSGVNNAGLPHVKWGYHSIQEEKGETFRPKTHAELNSISRCRQHIAGSVVINVRLTKKSEIRMSCPCKVCRHVMSVVGIKKCFFTTEFGWGSIEL